MSPLLLLTLTLIIIIIIIIVVVVVVVVILGEISRWCLLRAPPADLWVSPRRPAGSRLPAFPASARVCADRPAWKLSPPRRWCAALGPHACCTPWLPGGPRADSNSRLLHPSPHIRHGRPQPTRTNAGQATEDTGPIRMGRQRKINLCHPARKLRPQLCPNLPRRLGQTPGMRSHGQEIFERGEIDHH